MTDSNRVRALLYKLRKAEQELQAEYKAKIKNPGKVQRLSRRVRHLEERVDRLRTKERNDALRAMPRKAGVGYSLARRTPLKATAPLAGGSPLPPKNVVRAARLREERFSEEDGYGAFVRAQSCIRCGSGPPCDFAHIKGVDLGGKAEHGLPLCRLCHMWQETHKRQFEEEFLGRQGMTALEMAGALRAAYLLDRGEHA